MALPYPGMDAVPFTPLTAAFLDNMIANIASLADGTGIASAAIIAPKLNNSGTWNSSWVWTAWTPTVTAATGTFTTATGAGRWTQIGKTIHFQASCTITTIGTGTGCVFTLPVTAQASGLMIMGSAREDATAGSMGVARLSSSTTASVARYDNGNILNGSGSVVRVHGTYEAA